MTGNECQLDVSEGMPKSISYGIQIHMLIYQPHLYIFSHKGHWMLV